MPAVPAAPPEAVDLRLRELGVSRETLARLGGFVDLLGFWQRRINLVASAEPDAVWRRHVLDSARLLTLLPAGCRTLVDLGSGAGFPGLVLAILGVPEVHLVEADRRKAAFLREAARVTGTAGVRVHARRIEDLEPFPADAVTARALAPLPRLLALAEPWLAAGAVGLFPKGREVEAELTEAARSWTMELERLPGAAAPEGCILRIREARRVRPEPA